jgi:hypothetical protein
MEVPQKIAVAIETKIIFGCAIPPELGFYDLLGFASGQFRKAIKFDPGTLRDDLRVGDDSNVQPIQRFRERVQIFCRHGQIKRD